MVKTNCGRFKIRLDPRRSPVIVNSFAYLVRSGFYDGLQFYRVGPNSAIQGETQGEMGPAGPATTSSNRRPPTSISTWHGRDGELCRGAPRLGRQQLFRGRRPRWRDFAKVRSLGRPNQIRYGDHQANQGSASGPAGRPSPMIVRCPLSSSRKAAVAAATRSKPHPKGCAG